VVSQRLVPRADGHGRVAAVEILIATARVREMIEDKDRTKEIPDAISQGHQTYGMQTFDQSLMSLLRQKIITYDEALRQATNRDDFALRVSGISATSDSKWDDFESKQGAGPAAAPPPPPASSAPSNPTPIGRIAPVASRPSAPARPAAAAAPPAGGAGSASSPSSKDDDFQIERF
jgi:twitching motility protein PilT